MPLNLPQVPAREADPRDRILAKYHRYIEQHTRTHQQPGAGDRLKGERYEIQAAVHLHRLQKFLHGREITRWTGAADSSPQHVNCGANTEFDFVVDATMFPRLVGANVPALQGHLLGDAKNIRATYGPAIKNLLVYAMQNSLAGICLVGTRSREQSWSVMVSAVYSVLANPSSGPGIAGQWQTRPRSATRPSGAEVVQYFAQQYDTPDKITRRTRANVATINAELARYAGIYIVYYQVGASGSHDEFKDWFGSQPLQ